LTLLIGAGGNLVELFDDSVSLLLPAQRRDILAAVESLKINALINGYRGKAGGNIDSIVDSIESIAQYAAAHNDSLLELDVNPLAVLPQKTVVLDAFIRIQQVN